MWGLEYALLFGVPNNKLELIHGRSRCAFPFLDRQQAEAHLADWVETLCRWQGVAQPPAIRKGRKRWKAAVKGFVLELFPLPIDLRIPLDGDAFLASYESFWRRDLWGGQPPGRETGWEDFQPHYDVQLNLWGLFRTVCKRYGGLHGGRTDINLSDKAAVAPDQYYFRKTREECMINGDYFHGVPEVVVEVLSPATRAADRGPRKELYRRAGVAHLWLLDPEVESVELYELAGPDYHLAATFRPGEEFRPRPFPEVAVKVGALFDTQWKRHPEWFAASEPEPVPEWLAPPDKRLGLEYLLLLGHPERRREIWGNRAPCVLPFGSPGEAQVRFRHFLEDAARWEQAPAPTPSRPEPGMEQAEVGRFRLTRRGRHVHLEVAVDARKYRALLEVWTRREAWDWGEK
jgi:hypothetical protein